MQTSCLFSRTSCLLLAFVLIILVKVAPVIAWEKSDCFFSVWLAESQNEGGSSLGSLQPPQEQAAFKLKSENSALRWSLFGTLVPIATGATIWISYEPKDIYDNEPNTAIPVILILSGVFLGPSLGYFYAGESGRGLDGIGVRVIIAVVTTPLIGTVLASASGSDGGEFGGLGVVGAWEFAAIIASGLVIAYSIYDIAKVKSTVRKHNSQLQKASLILAPKYFADSKAYGMEIRLAF